MEQPQLIPDEPRRVDADAMAAHIAANARPVPSEDRTSAAAEDQGWGPVDLPTRIESPRLPKRATRPYRGKLRGESEMEITPAGREEYEPLDEAAKAAGRAGLALVRRVMNGR